MTKNIRFSALDDVTHAWLVHLERISQGKEVTITVESIGRRVEKIVGIFQGIHENRLLIWEQQIPFFWRTTFIRNIISGDGKEVYTNEGDSHIEKSLWGGFYIFQANKMAAQRAWWAFAYIEKQ